MNDIKLVLNEKYKLGNSIREPSVTTWFSSRRVAPALNWLLGKDRYSPTASSLANYLTKNGYPIKARTITDWRMRYRTPELLWQKVPALAIQLIVEAYNESRYQQPRNQNIK